MSDRPRRPFPGPLNVLINRTDAIGDTLLTAPMAQFIKKHYPDAKVYFLVSPRCKELLKSDAFIDGVEVISPKSPGLSLIFTMRRLIKKYQINCYYYVGGGGWPTFAAWLWRVPIRAGLLSRWPSFLFLNRGLRQQRSLVEMHELDYNLALLQKLGLNYLHTDRKELAPPIRMSAEEKQHELQILHTEMRSAGLEVAGEHVVIHPGMTGHTLNWPSRNYARLCLRLERRYPGRFNFVITYTPSDERFLAGLREEFSHGDYDTLRVRLYFLNGTLRGLTHTMGVIASAAFFVGPSTGTAHIANALGTKMVAIHSPIKTQSASRWGPAFGMGVNAQVVTPDVICGETLKCAKESCPYYECMSKIEVDDVIKEILAIWPGIPEGPRP